MGGNPRVIMFRGAAERHPASRSSGPAAAETSGSPVIARAPRHVVAAVSTTYGLVVSDNIPDTFNHVNHCPGHGTGRAITGRPHWQHGVRPDRLARARRPTCAGLRKVAARFASRVSDHGRGSSSQPGSHTWPEYQ